jgi:hypothetical protein
MDQSVAHVIQLLRFVMHALLPYKTTNLSTYLHAPASQDTTVESADLLPRMRPELGSKVIGRPLTSRANQALRPPIGGRDLGRYSNRDPLSLEPCSASSGYSDIEGMLLS